MNKTILITGATGTLGRATSFELAMSGATVVLLARNSTRLEWIKNEISVKSGNKNIDILIADFSQLSSVKSAVGDFRRKYDRLDALVNIAAVFKSKREITPDNLEMMFAVNHLAPFTIATGLLELLKESKPARIITVTAPSVTKLHFDDLQGEKEFSALTYFGASKMMNLMLTYSLARRLEGTGVTACAFHPGLMKSNLTREMPSVLRNITRLMSGKPDKAAKMLCSLAVDNKHSDLNGKFFKYNGKELKSSPYSHDEEVQEKLWTISQQISG